MAEASKTPKKAATKPKGPGKGNRTRNTNARTPEGQRLCTYRRFKEGVDYIPPTPDEMGAIIGLIQRAAKPTGQPPKYPDPEEFMGAVDAYWDYVNEVNEKGTPIIPDVEGIACYLGIDRETLRDWEHNRPEPYSATIKRAKNAIAFCKKQLALNGKIPAIVFATDFNNNHGYTQKQEVIVTPNMPLGDQLSQEEILQKAGELPSPDDYDV